MPKIHDPVFMEIDRTVLIKKKEKYNEVKPPLWSIIIIEKS